ncbi:MAG: alpha/beta hydrolase [Candidatus Roizmanbacteria bacterium]|nr:alpha/beta hydrolase [Candidatus Roizmanbacteria bacterium]
MKIKIQSKNQPLIAELSEVKNATGLVIFLSGLTGSRDLPLLKTASTYFCKNNLSTLRVNLCTMATLKDMTFKIYAERLRDVFVHFDKKYPKIILVGHSFGAIIAIIFLSVYPKYLKKTELIFWDPSLLPWEREWMEEDFSLNKKTGLYRDIHTKEIINKTFYEACIKTDSAVLSHSLPIKPFVVAAENSADKDAKKYSSKVVVLGSTDHCFSDKKAQKRLFEESIDFLRKKIKI